MERLGNRAPGKLKEILCGVETLHYKSALTYSPLRFRWSWRKVASFDDALKTSLFVCPVAKGFGLRVTTAAKTNRRSATQAEGFAVLVLNFKIPFDAYRAIVAHRNLCGCHAKASVGCEL